MNTSIKNEFGARRSLDAKGGRVTMVDINVLEKAGLGAVSRLPYSIKLCLENLLRTCDGRIVTPEVVAQTAAWATDHNDLTFPLTMARVLLPDSSGVPVMMDLAAMRDAVARLGGDPTKISPVVQGDFITDHSVTADFWGDSHAVERNIAKEFERNHERYALLKWGQEAFDNIRVIPPGLGICHQINLEYLAQVVNPRRIGNETLVFPDSVVGTDSHTPMINSIGIMGWGVGGIEAEMVLLGQPYFLPAPDVVGIRLHGDLTPGVLATDVVLSVTERLRAEGVVATFVEFFGSGVENLSIPDRATLANMAPEYGATMGFFPIDAVTLQYLELTNRGGDHADLVERYAKENGLFLEPGSQEPDFTRIVEFDLSDVEPSVAGPKRPQDRVSLNNVQESFRSYLTQPLAERGYGFDANEAAKKVSTSFEGEAQELGHGAVAMAAITSCTNTSNPGLLIAAGLLAKEAAEAGLKTPPWVKTALAPGSQVVSAYLRETDLMEPLEALGFYLVGYGCMICGGKSGPLSETMSTIVKDNDLVATAVLSANRNFEGRVHPLIRGSYLASPPLVVAFALAGRVDIDFETEPLGAGTDGENIFLKDIWPKPDDVRDTVHSALSTKMFEDAYAGVMVGPDAWKDLDAPKGERFTWQPGSTYLIEPPWFADAGEPHPWPDSLKNARILAQFGDSLTTDHILPGAQITPDSAAGRFLSDQGVEPQDFNATTQRRGNHHVMMRSTFANVRLNNLLVSGVEGGFTVKFPEGTHMDIFEAAELYRDEGTPMIVIAGKDYGMGSSRDWAAKGPALIGVKAVIAESVERIHRSNLIGMGVVPLLFKAGDNAQSLGLNGEECYEITGLKAGIIEGSPITIIAKNKDGAVTTFETKADVRSPFEADCLESGGVLVKVLREFLAK
ncbi:MAG: aconitate hydratase AcnA [Rhodospirillales bacterium]|nr:aconitate hydratase AcnA [Rhodospirillales bacterium]